VLYYINLLFTENWQHTQKHRKQSNRNSSEIVTCHRLGVSVLRFGDRYNISALKTEWNVTTGEN